MKSALAIAIKLPAQDVAPDPHAPITFERRGGGLVAKLGVIELGLVGHFPDVRMAFWLSQLPGGPSKAKAAPSIEIAQDRLAAHVRDWFAACGRPLPVSEARE